MSGDLADAARHLRGLAEWMQETRADLAPPPTPTEPPPAPVSADAPQTPASSSAPGNPAAALEELRRDGVGDCTRCKLHQGRQHIVFGVGDPQARLMFVGEGPGANEDRLGEPFVGRAGELLDRIIAATGMRRDDVYIANIVKCRPPGNRDPEADEVEQCEPFLHEQIRIVAPEVIVALGRVAANTLLRTDQALGKLRGQWHRYEGVALRATYHPAALLRNPDLKRACWDDVLEVMGRLGLERPLRRR